MKRIKYILLALTLMVSVSCNDFLKEDTFGTDTVEDLLKSQSSASLFLYTMYNSLRDQHDRYYLILDGGTDDQSCVPDNDGIDVVVAAHRITTDQSTITTAFWTEWWEMINRANFIIDRFPKQDYDADFIRQSVAEARTMRGYAYFHLVRLWGDVPFVNWFVERANYAYTEGLPRTDIKEIYEKIIFPDLEYGGEFGVETQAMQGRVTKWLAYTLLSEAYATYAGYRYDCYTGVQTKGDDIYWSKAREAALQVINNAPTAGYDLITDDGAYDSAYERVFEEEWNSETLLEVGYISENGQGSYRTKHCVQTGKGSFWVTNPVFDNPELELRTFSHSDGISVDGYCLPTPDLFHAFETGDERSWGILTNYKYTSEIYYLCMPTFRKHICFDTVIRTTGDETSISYDCKNARLYRVADAILLFAEADNEWNGPTAEALAQINRLRTRAGLAEITDMGSKDEWREKIHQERRVELHGEQKRRFDLVRWDKLSETKVYDEYWELSDNPVTASGYEGQSNMNNRYRYMFDYATQNETPFIEFGCETLTEMPRRSALMCFQLAIMEKNPEWQQNFGY